MKEGYSLLILLILIIITLSAVYHARQLSPEGAAQASVTGYLRSGQDLKEKKERLNLLLGRIRKNLNI
jgi:hypothetical protein